MNEIIKEKEREFLMSLARRVIESKKKIEPEKDVFDNYDPILNKSMGGFVTLHKNSLLRGCIGYILPINPVYKTIINNAYNAAYSDPRFTPVKPEEFDEIKIEISILTEPVTIKFESSAELLMRLKPGLHGVIIKKNYHSATFLPQVWDQLTSKEDFLSHLCIKAGLREDEWRNIEGLEVEVYQAQVFSE